MKTKLGGGSTIYGPGVSIDLDENDLTEGTVVETECSSFSKITGD